MAKRRFWRSFFTSFLLSVASAVGVTYLIRRFKHQPAVELYFDDGSMLAINNKSSEVSTRLTGMAEDLIRQSL
jgi:hypothetical protein